jgi:D-tyrosyl-tRNA(Tyr) deacylase
MLLVGFAQGDGADQIAWMADKVLGLRVFADADGKMNLALEDVGGDLLVVSQFTLYGDVSKGRRPSFVDAARPDIAVALYQDFIQALRARTTRAVETGEFGAMMEVEIVNDGPVTLVLDHD